MTPLDQLQALLRAYTPGQPNPPGLRTEIAAAAAATVAWLDAGGEPPPGLMDGQARAVLDALAVPPAATHRRPPPPRPVPVPPGR